MASSIPSRRFVAAMMFASGVLVASCSAVIGFPDRVLDESSDGSTPEGSDLPDGFGPDTSMTDGNVDAGPARATFSATTVDFGLVSCGAAAPAAKVITITNS